VALKLRVTTQAKRDTGRILGYIAKDNPDAAAKLADALEHGMQRLLDYPLIAPVVPNRINPDIRQLIIPPCRILYRVADPDLYIVGMMRCEQNIEESQFGGL
jgi:addiction module RelE/StbE family toxin